MIQSAIIIKYEGDIDKFFKELDMCMSSTSKSTYVIQCVETQNVLFSATYIDDGSGDISIDPTVRELTPDIILYGTSDDWKCIPLTTQLALATRGFQDVLRVKTIREVFVKQ